MKVKDWIFDGGMGGRYPILEPPERLMEGSKPGADLEPKKGRLLMAGGKERASLGLALLCFCSGQVRTSGGGGAKQKFVYRRGRGNDGGREGKKTFTLHQLNAKVEEKRRSARSK